uniref:TLC domain-containing protein n=1 Tax=Globodera pallida TaxID=36090 RepID=A0A183CFB1_GLOPA
MIGSSLNYSSILQTANEFKGSKIFTSLWWWGHVWLPLIVALLSFVFFRFFQFAVRWYLFGKWTFPTFSYFKRRRRRRPNSSVSTPSMDSKSLEFVPPNKKWRISNEFVSLVHSILSGFWALGILTHFDSYIDDLIGADSKEARYLTYMSLGYMVHDLIDLVVNERSARIIELLFHHVVVITAFMITQVTGQFLYIVVLGLLMEQQQESEDDEDEGLESDYNNGNGTASAGAEPVAPADSRGDIEAGRAVAATQQQLANKQLAKDGDDVVVPATIAASTTA